MTARDATLHPRPGLLQEEIDGDLVILDPDSGLLHVLRGTATAAWSALRQGRATAELVREVTGVFGVSADGPEGAELLRFLEDLQRLGLVVRDT